MARKENLRELDITDSTPLSYSFEEGEETKPSAAQRNSSLNMYSLSKLSPRSSWSKMESSIEEVPENAPEKFSFKKKLSFVLRSTISSGSKINENNTVKIELE